MTLILRYDGTTWEIVGSPNGSYFNTNLYGVDASPQGDLWAVGRSYNDYNTPWETFILQNDCPKAGETPTPTTTGTATFTPSPTATETATPTTLPTTTVVPSSTATMTPSPTPTFPLPTATITPTGLPPTPTVTMSATVTVSVPTATVPPAEPKLYLPLVHRN